LPVGLSDPLNEKGEQDPDPRMSEKQMSARE
jgi:hypothetical protein